MQSKIRETKTKEKKQLKQRVLGGGNAWRDALEMNLANPRNIQMF